MIGPTFIIIIAVSPKKNLKKFCFLLKNQGIVKLDPILRRLEFSSLVELSRYKIIFMFLVNL